MKFTDALILAVILVGGYHYFFDKDELTGNESKRRLSTVWSRIQDPVT